MHAYVLCGGFGTRLRPVINDSQKAVVDIHGRPFLSLVLEQLSKAGISHAVLCAHYRADQLAAVLPALEQETGLTMQLVVEEVPMGTGGALLNALRESKPSGRYLVLNADTYLEARAYRSALEAKRDVVVAVQVDDRSRYGSLKRSAHGEVLGFSEKGQIGSGWVNAGVYGFQESAIAHLPVMQASMEHDILPDFIARRLLYVCEYAGAFIDIGTPDSLGAFKAYFPMKEK